MKIRNGFVSNSSSSSFCLYGVSFDSSEVFKNDGDNDLYTKADEVGLNYYNMDGCAEYVGLSFTSIKDDETGAQFKERATKLVSEFLGKPTKCSVEIE